MGKCIAWELIPSADVATHFGSWPSEPLQAGHLPLEDLALTLLTELGALAEELTPAGLLSSYGLNLQQKGQFKNYISIQ